MDTVNQLLSKAMSTTSEQEAVSCLKMARKKSNSLPAPVSAEYNGQNAEYWYRKAEIFYTKLKEETSKTKRQEQPSANHILEIINLRRELVALTTANIKLEAENNKISQQVKKAEGQKTEHMMSGAFYAVIITSLFMIYLLT